MIVKSLVGLSLVLSVSLDAELPKPPAAVAWNHFSARHIEAALLPLVQRATDCIVRQVSADPRYTRRRRPGRNQPIDHRFHHGLRAPGAGDDPSA